MKYRLVCFDVDGTLVDNVIYSWEIFHDYFKVDMKRRENARKQFFDGKINYEEWALHDISLWKEKNARKNDFLEAIKPLKLMNGAIETVRELKNRNLKLAVISGSINVILETLMPYYNKYFDDVFLNRLVFDKNGNIIDLKITPYDIDGKAEAMKTIASKENISLNECVFIGDHRNDIPVMKECGLSIAFDPKDDELRKIADVVIEKKDLREVLKHII